MKEIPRKQEGRKSAKGKEAKAVNRRHGGAKKFSPTIGFLEALLELEN